MAKNSIDCQDTVKCHEFYIVCNDARTLQYLKQSTGVVQAVSANLGRAIFLTPQLKVIELEKIGPQHFLICAHVCNRPIEYQDVIDNLHEINNNFKLKSGNVSLIQTSHRSLFAKEDDLYKNIENKVIKTIENFFKT